MPDLILDQPELRCPKGHVIKDNLDREADIETELRFKATAKARKALKREPTESELMDFISTAPRKRSLSYVACEECAKQVVIRHQGEALQGRQDELDMPMMEIKKTDCTSPRLCIGCELPMTNGICPLCGGDECK